jgi:hypothetical protein
VDQRHQVLPTDARLGGEHSGVNDERWSGERSGVNDERWSGEHLDLGLVPLVVHVVECGSAGSVRGASAVAANAARALMVSDREVVELSEALRVAREESQRCAEHVAVLTAELVRERNRGSQLAEDAKRLCNLVSALFQARPDMPVHPLLAQILMRHSGRPGELLASVAGGV